MSGQREDADLNALFDGLKTDVASYFTRARDAVGDIIIDGSFAELAISHERDRFWSDLPDDLRREAKRLDHRLISLMGQIASMVRIAPLASEADQRDVVTGNKTMRAALHLRHFRAWNAEVLHDEGVILGVAPAGQSDERPSSPHDASQIFNRMGGKIAAILELVAASPNAGRGGPLGSSEIVRYRPGTAFVMMWMDKARPELTDLF